MDIENKIKQTEKLMQYLDRDEQLECMLSAFAETIIDLYKEYKKGDVDIIVYFSTLKWAVRMMVNEVNDLFEREKQ